MSNETPLVEQLRRVINTKYAEINDLLAQNEALHAENEQLREDNARALSAGRAWKVVKRPEDLPIGCEHIDHDTTIVYVSVCEKDEGGLMQFKGYAYLEILPFDSEAALSALRTTPKERT